MITAALKYAEQGMSITAILISVSIAIFIFLVQTFISRYFKYLDKKEEMADSRNKAVTDRLDILKDTVKELGVQYLQLLEKVNVTGVKLEDTVNRVGRLETEVGILKEFKKAG